MKEEITFTMLFLSFANGVSYEDYNTHEDTSYYGEPIIKGEDLKKFILKYEPPNNEPMIRYIKLPIDHFRRTNIRRWNMMCIQNTKFWRPDAPIYLFVRGNRPLKFNEVKEGLMHDLANETGGVIISAEHRYYGKDDPHRDFSYLTSEQAIADLYTLLKRIKSIPEYSKSKVVLFGGGYGGSLAVWLKQLHADIADVVVASSAPLLAKADFKEYFMHAANVFKKFMPMECAANIKAQVYTFEFCLNNVHTKECLKSQSSYLEMCESVDIEARESKQLFALSELSIYSDAAGRGMRQMYRVCKSLKLNNRTQEPSIFWDEENLCYNYDIRNFIKSIKENAANRNVRRWFYQCCNEFGFFPTTAAYPSPLSLLIPVEFYYKLCSDLFGRHFNAYRVNQNVKRTNQRYGGLRPNVDNVIFVFGELDPWQHVGVVKRFSETTNVVIIPESTHCRDLEPRNRSDTVALSRGRNQIKEFVKQRLHSTENYKNNELLLKVAAEKFKRNNLSVSNQPEEVQRKLLRNMLELLCESQKTGSCS